MPEIYHVSGPHSRAYRGLSRGPGVALDSRTGVTDNACHGTSAPPAPRPVVNLNLISVFDFYLAFLFLVSVLLRIRQYQAVLKLVRRVPSRWPKLFDLVKQHRSVFLTWATLAPALAALVLMVAQIVASRRIWPEAGDPEHGLTVARLLEHGVALVVVSFLAVLMIGVDLYATLVVSEVNREEIEGYFDQAEYWLGTWKAPVVRIFTLGYINPRQMVTVEVRSALVSASQMLNSTLWWLVVQTGLRVACGLALWGAYAWSRW